MLWTRPDLAYTAPSLGQFSANPGPDHWNCMKHIMRYLRGTKSMELQYTGSDSLNFHGFTDSDFAGDYTGDAEINVRSRIHDVRRSSQLGEQASDNGGSVLNRSRIYRHRIRSQGSHLSSTTASRNRTNIHRSGGTELLATKSLGGNHQRTVGNGCKQSVYFVAASSDKRAQQHQLANNTVNVERHV